MIELSSFQGNILVMDPTRRDEAVWGVWRYASNYYWLEKPIQCYILVRQIQVECHTILHVAELKSTQGWQERAQSLYREAKNWIYKNLHSHICDLSPISGFSFQNHTLKKYLKWIKNVKRERYSLSAVMNIHSFNYWLINICDMTCGQWIILRSLVIYLRYSVRYFLKSTPMLTQVSTHPCTFRWQSVTCASYCLHRLNNRE